MDFITDFKVEQLPNSEVKITGEIPFSELEKERGKAISSLSKNLKIDGFRPGRVPDKVVIERLGEMTIVAEMGERALARIYPVALRTLNIEAIGYPAITITKIAPGNPLGFTATTATLPAITLPDYKALAKSTNATKVDVNITDEDVAAAIKDIMRQRLAYERMQQKAAASHQHDHVHDEHCDHEHAGEETLPAPEHAPDSEEVAEPVLPELTDEYARGLGKFDSVDDLRSTLKDHLAKEKLSETTAAHRAKLTDSIIDGANMELPKVLVESELEQMFGQMTEDLTRANLKMDEYLGHIKKSKEDLFKEWEPAAEKRAKLQLVLNEIAKTENITPDSSTVEDQVGALMERYPDADRARVRVYVESILRNEAVMKLLEEQ